MSVLQEAAGHTTGTRPGQFRRGAEAGAPLRPGRRTSSEVQYCEHECCLMQAQISHGMPQCRWDSVALCSFSTASSAWEWPQRSIQLSADSTISSNGELAHAGHAALSASSSLGRLSCANKNAWALHRSRFKD